MFRDGLTDQNFGVRLGQLQPNYGANVQDSE